MYYYEVLVGDLKFHGSEPLTYSHTVELPVGTIVQIPMRNIRVLGIVTKKVAKPSFATKPIKAVADAPPIPGETLQLMDWLQSYYPAPLGTIVRQFLPPTTVLPKQSFRSKASPAKPSIALPPLTPEQTKAVEQLDSPGYHLLHGVTGSGKTRVYQELTARTLQRGRSTIILTPEIGLTSQLASAFEGVFGVPVRVLHSRLKPTERRTLWYEILNEQGPQIVLGPRSALFGPVQNVGLIVLDESHDQSYKSDSAPHYRSERVAGQLAHLHDATLVSGTATPSVEEYFVATAKQLPIVTLDSTALPQAHDVALRVVDMRDKATHSQSSLLSNDLLGAMQQTISHGEQCLLFLNRRGTANTILCSACGWQALCAHCDLPLTYHADKHTTLCHQCGRTKPMRMSCPECHNTDILLRSFGTKAVVEEVQKFFPHITIQRFDTDTHKTEQLEQQAEELRSGKVQILVGTQMIAKGLDLPKLSLVGILNADGGLSLPDYTAGERTNYLLNQVAGRIGRGHAQDRPGTLLVQTYRPDNHIVLTGAKQDWKSFYDHELEERRLYDFSPFKYMLKLTCARATSTSAKRTAEAFASQLRSQKGIAVEGPAPAFYARDNQKYVWNIIVKSSSRSNLLSVIQLLPSGWSYDIDPISLL